MTASLPRCGPTESRIAAEPRLLQHPRAVGDEVRADVEVVDGVLLELVEGPVVQRGDRDRLAEGVRPDVAGLRETLGRLQPPPVAGRGIHRGKDVVQRAQQVAAVVDQQELVVRRDDVPADQLTGELRPRAEVVGTVPDAPSAPGDAVEPGQLLGRQVPVVQDVHVGVPGELGDVPDDVVVDPGVAVEGREQAQAAGAGREGGGARRRCGGRGETPEARLAALAHPVHERVDGVAARVEVGRPVPPDVEVGARAAQLAPAGLAEVAERIHLPELGVRRTVVVLVEQPR